MDLTMLSTIFLVFVMLILSCIILCIWPLISNMFSEQRTRNALKGVLADLEGTLLSDITLPLNASQTTQIDHIFISTKGIFIIEEKNYTGDIYGALDDKTWTVVYGFGKAKHKMLNPFVQNKTHISGVCRAIKRGDEGIVNVVLLTGSSKFMVDPVPECCAVIVMTSVTSSLRTMLSPCLVLRRLAGSKMTCVKQCCRRRC